MSVWKTIKPEDVNYHTFVVHKQFNLDSSSHGQKFIQFKSGSSTDFSSNNSGSYWDANRVNFYLSGSSFHYTSETSSYSDGNMFDGFTYTAFEGYFNKPTYTHKFNLTGSTLAISQYYFGNEIEKGSFKLTDNSHPSGTVIIVDDGYGNLYAPSCSISSSNTNLSSSDNYVGNIAYSLGIINITETGSFSHTPSTASITFTNTAISHSQEFHISASDLSTTVKFMVNSGSITGSDDTNLFYFTSASGHTQTSESAYITALYASKKINDQFNLSSPSGSFISTSCESSDSFSTNPVLSLTNVNKPNRPIHNIDNLPPITASLGNIGYTISGFGGGTAPVNYTSVGTGLDGGIGSGSYTINFNSVSFIKSKEYSLKIGKNDFNFTMNPTVRKFGSTAETKAAASKLNSPYIKDDILSSSLSGSWGPMMTTVGFYRQYEDGTMDNTPIMVAKYPQPIMMRRDIDLILKIRIDI